VLTAVLDLVSNSLGNPFNTTPPGVAEEDYWTLLQETYPPGDNTTYLSSSGPSWTSCTLSKGPEVVYRIVNIRVTVVHRFNYVSAGTCRLLWRLKGDAISLGERYEYPSGAGQGPWVAVTSEHNNLNILANSWFTNEYWVEIFPSAVGGDVIDVSTIHVEIDYEEFADFNGTSLDVKVAKQVGQHTQFSSVYGTNPIPAGEESQYILVPSLPYISGASMPAGTRWLVWASASLGSSTATGVVECFLINSQGGTTKDLLHGLFKGTGHGTPESARGSHMGRWFEYVSDGSALRFAIRNVQGSGVNPGGVMIQGAIIIAIPMYSSFTFGSGMDWNAVSGSLVESTPDLNTTLTVFQPVKTMSYTAPADGEYLILAGTECKFNAGEMARARVDVNGVPRLSLWTKRSADNRETHSFVGAEIVTLNAGANTITITGASYTGANAKNFFRSSIVILRLARFGAYVQTIYPDPTTLNVAVTYPTWESEVAATYTPYVAGEYALVIGSGMVYRPTTQSYMMMRTYNATEFHPMHDFCASAHPTSSSGESNVLMSCGAELVNEPNLYQAMLTGESGYGDTILGVVQWPMSIIVLGLTAVAAPNPQAITIDGFETVGFSENTTLPVAGNIIDETETATVGELGSVDPVSPISVPVNHPRLWFNDGGAREAYLIGQKNANSIAWSRLAGSPTAQSNAWVRVLYWLMTQNPTDLSAAAGLIDSITSDTLTNIINAGDGDDGLYWWDRMQKLAYSYDWLMWKGVLTSDSSWLARKKRMEDTMMASCYMVFNPTSNLLGGDGSNSGWGINDSLNNYHYRKMGGAALVAIALYHEWDTNGGTFSWPAGSATSYQWSARVVSGGSTGPLYTDIRQWVVAKLESQAIPDISKYSAGGGWHEGANYGRAAMRHSLEWLINMKRGGWKNYIDQYSNWRESILYEIYAQQPGNTNLIHHSTAPSSNFRLPVNDYDRHLVLLAVDAFPSTSEASYGQWMLDNQSFPMGSTSQDLRGDEFLLYNNLGSIDYRLVLPTHRKTSAIGVFNSRGGWTSIDDSVTINSGPLPSTAEHWDEDSLGLQIWVSGWLMIDQRYLTADQSAYNSEATMAAANWHSGYVLANWSVCARAGSATTLPAGSIARSTGTAAYGYAQAEANDGWYTKTSSSHFASPVTKINDVAIREMFHLKALGFVVIYDRIKFRAAYVSGPARGYYQWRVQPTGFGQTHRIDNNGRTVWRRFMDSLATSVIEPSVNGYRDNFTLNLSGGYGEQRTVFQSTPVSTSNMTGMTVTPETGSLLPPGNMKGVSIQAATYQHVLFSASQDGTTPGTSVNYYVLRNATSDQHYVCNLKPGYTYFIAETNEGSGYYRYTLSETTDTGFVANEAGVVEFTPAGLTGQGVKNIVSDETVPYPIETGSLDYGAGIVSDLEAVGTLETGDLVSSAGNIISIDGEEFVGVTESDNWTFDISGFDTIGVSESGDFEHVAPLPRPPFYTEKIISSYNPDLVPNESVALSFMYPEPQSTPHHQILADTDDNTFLRITYPGVIANDMIAGLTDPTGYIGTIRAVQFHARFRKIDASGMDTPKVLFFLYDQAYNLMKQYSVDITNVDEANPVTFSSPLMLLDIPLDVALGVLLKAQIRAVSYNGYASFDTVAQLSRVWMSVVGDASEKVIN